ncbi:cytochrome d ubiquinol oxidase subunit II [Thermocatellispora tengchongensis]|uniref:Cytochrome d ubiquinol oxidase subunit II n=1 Tax=Thermocatellispora tengchongensis TaxID=1073253 RepID=A0A840NU31_9ACTN|nr:cytochrome d ubiquinol oxidase subunit II [Thermocatellispora tengchongensis]MBB5131078.1 cytochrome d ubiquinol oxidase subunit II [Thermocatellispora tengchongensis]
MELTTFWFVLIAFLWTGYFLLEGFDFGVGVLAPVLARDEAQHRQIVHTIGPVWDGNEVWLITAVGAMFAAFPAWYSGMLSQFYLPLVLVLCGLIVRGVGLEWRGKVTTPAGRAWCDLGVMAGSGLPAFLWGAIFADLLLDSGLAALVGGLFSLSMCLLHGAVFIALKTEGPVRRSARSAAVAAALAAVPLGVVSLSAIPGGGPWPVWALALVAMAGLAASVALIWRRREGWAFTATATVIVAGTAALFTSIWPEPLPGLTVAEAASGPYTLNVLTWIGLAALPFVVGYQAWTYWVFRKRLTQEAAAV